MPAYFTLLRHGRPIEQFTLPAGEHIIGRDPGGALTIPDPSVSRQHAEISVAADDSVTLRDLDSSNGIKINGVPRKSGPLHASDHIHIGKAELVYSPTPPPRAGPSQKLGLDTAVDQHLTQRQSLRLPDARPERHLAAFYHLSAWVTEGVEEEQGLQRWLELLGESLRAHTIHFYDPKGKLAHVHSPEGPKPKIKFASYLLERFAALPEATAYAPRELDRFQQRLGNFHYIVAPLRLARDNQPENTSPCAVAVAIRPAEWEPFATDDRVLMQSACQMWLNAIRRASEVHQLKTENTQLRKRAKSTSDDGLLGSSSTLEKLRAHIARVAKTKATVLISGETGSGKEVVAGDVHQHSPRAAQSFIKINCGAIPDGLIESELFGHVKGAFTDARSDRQGKFTLADGGTLFLDEIGELPLTAQTKLLRVLEEGLVEPLGSEKPRKIDVRVIAATNRDLSAEVTARRFREDLFYRLNVVAIKIPPLRDHVGDLPELAQHFLDAFCTESGLAELTLAAPALKALQKRDWPGNVRELRNVIQRLAIEATGPTITAADVKTLD